MSNSDTEVEAKKSHKKMKRAVSNALKFAFETARFGVYKLTAVILSVASAATAVTSAVASAATASASVAVEKNKSDYNIPEALGVLKEIT